MLKNNNKIEVPKQVLIGIDTVRNSGLTNMFDVIVVVKILEAINMHDAAVWILSNKELYVEGIFKGFKSKE